MSNFPQNFDDDTTLPVVNDNLTEIGGFAINSLRDAVFNIEQNIGLGANGTVPSIAARLGILINPDGSPNISTLTSIGLVTLPITNNQIADNAGIPESKLSLNYPTLTLFTFIQSLSSGVRAALDWIAITGVKLEPHLLGAIYRHDLSQIDVADVSSQFLNNVFRVQRNNTNSYTLINDINNELLVHQWADGSPLVGSHNIITNDGSTYPSNYGHTASGIFVNTSRFQTIPQTAQDVQLSLEYIDQSSILLLGTRIQNLYANGISVNSRSSSLPTDGYGQPIIPVTPATAYLLGQFGSSSSPVDSINFGDDIIQFNPPSSETSSNSFDAQFALVRAGDIIRINYGAVEVAWVISEIKYNQSGINKTYLVRIAGKNLSYTTNAVARIDRPLFNSNKYGVLATAIANSVANSSNIPASLIVTNPRGAQAVGVGFNPDQFDSTHYLLYLALYPDGNPNDGYTILPGIDVTGNAGTTPGAYTLDSIISATNVAFRAPGYNYRFVAFESNGEFGIMLADSYNNVSFSILNMVVTPAGMPDPVNTPLNFPNNVVGGLTDGYNYPDPLGFGILGANIASPPFLTSYGSAAASQFPTKLFVPLRRNNFYVNGAEREQLNKQIDQTLDQYGDGYWVATIDGYSVIPGPPGHVTTTFTIPHNLSNSDLKIGKTLVVQSLNFGSLVDFGRFIISEINFVTSPTPSTQITVYDSVHATGVSPSPTFASMGGSGQFAIYFNSDSVGFNQETATDFATPTPPFRRRFEIYVDQDGNTYSHERARMNISGGSVTVNGVTLYGGSLAPFINLIGVSSKMTGFNVGSGVVKINLQIISYDLATGIYDGYLCNYNGTSVSNLGPITFGQTGQITRFYDQTNIDYIDILFETNGSSPIPSFINQNVDIQLFPTLSLDQEIMLLSTCQFSDSTFQSTYLNDERQFGNTSEEQFTTSAIDYISATDKELHENGIIRGFDCLLFGLSVNGTNTIAFAGGEAFVNGKLIQVDPQEVTIPTVLEALPTVIGGAPTITSTVNAITWFVCVNNQGEIQLIASTDFDPLGSFITQYEAAGLNHLRLFYVMNPNAISPSPYQVRGTYFAGLVINNLDVVPIAIVYATATSSGGTYSISNMLINDARRYITNGYGGLTNPLTLGNGASFRSFNSLTTWLFQFNNLFSASFGQSNPISNNVIVKGHVDIIFPIFLGYIYGDVYFEGDNGSFDVFVPTAFELGSNIHFNNITFNYFYDPVVYDSVYGDVTSGRYNPTNPGSNAPADLINASRTDLAVGKGLIHIGMGSPPFNIFVKNVSITNCNFNWYPLVAGSGGLPPFVPVAPISSTAINRFSFILIEYGQATSGAAPIILQNIDISGNTFTDNVLPSFILANYETVRSIIAFVCLSTIQFSQSKLINATIKNNICNKDQLIAIVPTSATDGYVTVNTAIDTTSCVIEENVCGAISIFTQYTYPLDVDYTSNYFNFTLDKNNSLIVSKNTCKYITSTDDHGIELVVTSGPNNAILTNTGPMTISDNTVSWIKLPLNIVIPGATPCIIKNNKLNAYDINFRKNYLNNNNAFLTNAAIELIIIGTSFVNSVIIDGNWISDGFYTTFTPPISNPTYDIGIYTQHDADICNNVIVGLAPVLNALINPIGIQLNTGFTSVLSSNIHHNKLFRESKVWRAYIDVSLGSGSCDHTITNNFFDQLTADNVNFGGQIIVGAGLSNIHDNTNQSISTAISLLDHTFNYGSSGSPAFSGTGPAFSNPFVNADTINGVFLSRFTQVPALGNGPPTSNYTVISELANNGSPITPHLRNFSFTISLTDRLPPGVKILGASMGVWVQYTGTATFNTAVDGYNAFTLTLSTYNNNLTSGGSPAGITDIKANITPDSVQHFVGADNSYLTGELYTLLVSATPSTGFNAFGPYAIVTPAFIASNTNYLIVSTPTVPAGQHFVTGNDYRINATIDVNYLRGGGTTTSDSMYIYFSPLLVTYKW